MGCPMFQFMCFPSWSTRKLHILRPKNGMARSHCSSLFRFPVYSIYMAPHTNSEHRTLPRIHMGLVSLCLLTPRQCEGLGVNHVERATQSSLESQFSNHLGDQSSQPHHTRAKMRVGMADLPGCSSQITLPSRWRLFICSKRTQMTHLWDFPCLLSMCELKSCGLIGTDSQDRNYFPFQPGALQCFSTQL